MNTDPLHSRIDAIPTQWSLIRDAHTAGTPQTAAQARQTLVLRYAKSIRRYVGGIVKQSEDADELAQDVIVRLMKGDFAGADPTRGRFRDLLKTAVRNMIHNHWAKSNRRKSAALQIELIAGSEDSDPAWENAFQLNILEHAWAALKAFEKVNPGLPAHTVMTLRVEFPETSSEELATKLGEKLGKSIRAENCRQMLRRARLKFAEALVDEIQLGLADASPARIAEELAHLGLLEYVKDFLPDDWTHSGKLAE